MIAVFNAIVGALLAFLIGMKGFGMAAREIWFSILMANVMGLGSLLLVLKGERTTWSRRRFFRGSISTWVVMAVLFFGGLLLFVGSLRDVACLSAMAIPLILTTGGAILAFGPIQDWLVARKQRRAWRK